MKTQEEYLKQHFTEGYTPSDKELNEMRKKLNEKGRLTESFYRMG